MKDRRIILAVVVVLMAHIPIAWAQTENPASLATAPPKLVLLVHQQFQFGKAGARQKLEVAMSRACDRLTVPNSWIDLESITGLPEALSFDPFDSFDGVDKAFLAWGQIFAAHPDLARMQGEIDVTLSSQRTLIAVRRDDLGFRVNEIDLSKAHFIRVLEVRLHPGHESDFVEAFKTLSAAHERINSDIPWVVYQVNVGLPSPSFLVFVPMIALRQNEDLLARRMSLQEAEGEEGFQRMQQIARDAYAATESNLYAVSPEMSHVSREFAEGDPAFWTPKGPSSKNAGNKAGAKPSTEKDGDAKQN